MIIALEKYESKLRHEYESLHALTTPSQDIRRKMDSCTSVTSEIIALLRRCHADVGNKDFDTVAEKELLQNLLQRDDARSIYGSTVSRAGRENFHAGYVSVKRADVAARLAVKRAEIVRKSLPKGRRC